MIYLWKITKNIKLSVWRGNIQKPTKLKFVGIFLQNFENWNIGLLTLHKYMLQLILRNKIESYSCLSNAQFNIFLLYLSYWPEKAVWRVPNVTGSAPNFFVRY